MHAVVFAYHDVGVQCLKALVNAGIKIDLVLTHQDDPNENVWFASVAKLCESEKIPYLTPSASELKSLIPRIQELAPDYLFSFYYRYMIPAELLACAKIAALNMHGSLLPKYRGRAPVNWAILHGETETGATLHIMEAKPDAGDIVGQKSVTGKKVVELHFFFENLVELGSGHDHWLLDVDHGSQEKCRAFGSK